MRSAPRDRLYSAGRAPPQPFRWWHEPDLPSRCLINKAAYDKSRTVVENSTFLKTRPLAGFLFVLRRKASFQSQTKMPESKLIYRCRAKFTQQHYLSLLFRSCDLLTALPTNCSKGERRWMRTSRMRQKRKQLQLFGSFSLRHFNYRFIAQSLKLYRY